MSLKNLVDIVVAKIRDRKSRYLPRHYFEDSTRLIGILKKEDPYSERYAQAVDDIYLFSRRAARHHEQFSEALIEISKKYPRSRDLTLKFLEKQKENSEIFADLAKISEVFRERYYQWRRGEISFDEVLKSLIAGTKNQGQEE